MNLSLASANNSNKLTEALRKSKAEVKAINPINQYKQSKQTAKISNFSEKRQEFLKQPLLSLNLTNLKSKIVTLELNNNIY